MLKEERTVSQIAAAHQIHPGQRHRWKRQALDHFAQLFTESETLKQQAQAHDQEMTALYAPMGKLTTQVGWLKKIWPRPCLAVSACSWSIRARRPCR